MSNAKSLEIAWRWQSLPGEGQPDVTKTTGAPMTYLHQGKQYIVVAVSTREHQAEYVALALPDSARSQVAAPSDVAPPPPAARGPAPGPPALTSLRDAAVIRERVTKGGVQMPAMRTVLTEEQIRDVSDYVAAGLPPDAP